MATAGVDIGSATTKTVILDTDGQILGTTIVPTGNNSRIAADQSLDRALASAGLTRDELDCIAATGYGREIAAFTQVRITEITCHARGIHMLNPEVESILDIGGQDSKAIRIETSGRVTDFAMNDKCAAGTGRFLEVMARTLEVPLETMGPLSLSSENPVSVSSMCTVFAESEVISLIATGRPVADIVAGIHQAITDRTAGLLERVRWTGTLAFTGGVAKNVGVTRAIETRLGVQIWIPPEPQLTGALGAAAIARERAASAGNN